MTMAGVAHEVSRALDCIARSDGRGFDSQGVSIPRVLKKMRNDGASKISSVVSLFSLGLVLSC